MKKGLNFSLRVSQEARYQKASCERRSGGKMFTYLEWKEQFRVAENINPDQYFFRKREKTSTVSTA